MEEQLEEERERRVAAEEALSAAQDQISRWGHWSEGQCCPKSGDPSSLNGCTVPVLWLQTKAECSN